MSIHLIIKEERRKAPRQLAQVVNADIRTPDGVDAKGMPKFIVTPMPPQLHTMAEEINSFSNIEYAAEWDGKTPYISILKGNINDIKMAYAGWPMVDKATWLASLPPPDKL